MAVSLPQEVILFQIITRVPPKSAVRFKCVSKQWNSFLTSERFEEMHSDHNLLRDCVYPHVEDQNLLFHSQGESTFYTIECESPPDKAPCRRPLPRFTTRPPKYIHILTSCHGLVCLHIENNVPKRKRTRNVRRDFDIILWNPVTTEYKTLSRPSDPDHMECYKGSGYGLYYSSDEDDYKLLVITESDNVYIYSLKSDTWRKLDTKFLFQGSLTWTPGFCLNKYLYFLSRGYKIEGSMRFDTETKTFHQIKTPPVSYEMAKISITVQKGSIHLYAMYGEDEDICMEVWKYIADEDIWSKVVNYKLLDNYDIRGLYPLHLMSNGNLLMKDNDKGGRICQVDLIKTKDKKDNHGEYYDEYNLLYNSDFTVGNPEDVIYTETFVSPNQYMK